MKASTTVSKVKYDERDDEPGPHKEDSGGLSRPRASLEAGVLHSCRTRTSLVMGAPRRMREGMNGERQAGMLEDDISIVQLGIEKSHTFALVDSIAGLLSIRASSATSAS